MRPCGKTIVIEINHVKKISMNTKKSITLFLSIFIILAMINTGCKKFTRIEGNGNVIEETRMTVSFKEIENDDNFDVYYVKDSIHKIVIEAESNLIPHIRTNINSNTMIISTRERLSNNFPMKIYVYAPYVNSVHISGSGIISTGSFDVDEFAASISGSGVIYGEVTCNNFRSYISGSGEIDFIVFSPTVKSTISGSGEIYLEGVSNRGDYNISGSGSIDAYNLSLIECDANISGSGNIYTKVSEYLNAKISGSGNIYYIGNPIVYTNISGSGNVIKQ